MSCNKVLLQQRAEEGKWTASTGWYFLRDEDYLEAAQREFAEELGIELSVNFFGELCFQSFRTSYRQEVNDKFVKAFILRKIFS